jgi:beta-galactosidase
VIYEPGELKLIAYKGGKQWATEIMRTAGKAAKLDISADRKIIAADGKELSFITIRVLDDKGIIVPEANNHIAFEISRAGEIVATDNGDPADLTCFHSKERNAFNGLALVIVQSKPGMTGIIKITAKSNNLLPSEITIRSQN